MQKIYTAQDINEAQIIKGLLEANNITAFVNGFYLQGGIGEISPADFAAVSVEAEQSDAALKIINEYEKNTSTNASSEQVKPIQFNKSLIIIPIIIIAFFVATLLVAQ